MGKRKVPVKIVKTVESAVVPFYATPNAAGFDLVAAYDILLAPQDKRVVGTGLRFEIPPGYEIQIRPRSGVSANTDLVVVNSPGTLDSDYRGELRVILRNTSPMTPHNINIVLRPDGSAVELPDDAVAPVGSILIRAGDRVAQGVLAAVQQAEFTVTTELSETERQDGGFGSTGIN